MPERREFPSSRLYLGEFILELEELTNPGDWDPRKRTFTGVSGTAWVAFDCPAEPLLVFTGGEITGPIQLQQRLEVVSTALHPQTQISYAEAQRLRPGVRIGESIEVAMTVHPAEVQGILQTSGVFSWLETNRLKGGVLVRFQELTVRLVGREPVRAEVVAGSAFGVTPPVVSFTAAGFRIELENLVLRPQGASASVTLELPGGLVSPETCQPARLALGEVRVSRDCEVYVEAPEASFGPWILGDTGMVVKGTGYTVDLSQTVSPGGRAPAWRGVVLHSAQATGRDLIPEPNNTGWLRGLYFFTDGILTQSGLDATLNLAEPCSFQTLNPLGWKVHLEAGWLQLDNSRITAGELGPGQATLSPRTICGQTPGHAVTVAFAALTVQSDLDLAGEAVLAPGLDVSWGELSHRGSEVVAWTAHAEQAFLYLPANPMPAFCPDQGTGFLSLSPVTLAAAVFNQMETHGMAGLALRQLSGVRAYSPDRPHGTANPLSFQHATGWLHAGAPGVSGQLETEPRLDGVELGDPSLAGYVGKRPFQAALFSHQKMNLIGQFASSAVYDSRLDGSLNIPEPCKIDALAFEDMKFTSTARLVGGNVVLPVAGVTLDHWQLQLVPTGDPSQAGVVSVRTGRIVFTAAGLWEKVHFERPFGLTWLEMLADGDLGELFLDYNNYGQRFDGFPYTPSRLLISKYVPGATNAYLATCGSVVFNFFGPHFVNIHDARYAVVAAPYHSRKVTTPKPSEAGCGATNLHLQRTWFDQTQASLAAFDFPDATMDYNASRQWGFAGGGTTGIGFLHSGALSSQIELTAEAIDIRLSSEETHDIDFGLYERLGGIRSICGCARIEGPLLTRLSLYGLLEACSTAGTGILAPKAGYAVEVNVTTTPNSLDFSLAGDVLLQVAATAVDLSASVHLLHDYARGSAEGQVIGRIDCNSVLAGLDGEGQITWYTGPDMQYLQGRLRVHVCAWIADGSMEGGFFVGHKVPKQLAWVLQTDSEHFGVSNAILPAYLTGLFGYGMISLSRQFYIFGGGIEIYAGMGAFVDTPVGKQGAWPSDWAPALGLPYVIGSCGVYLHGEILGGLVSASAWGKLSLRGPLTIFFEGNFGLEGCVLWVICASIEVTAGIGSDGFYLN